MVPREFPLLSNSCILWLSLSDTAKIPLGRKAQSTGVCICKKRFIPFKVRFCGHLSQFFFTFWLLCTVIVVRACMDPTFANDIG